MKVAFDISRMNKLSLNRGIGIHAKNLFSALKEYTNVDIDLIDEKTRYDQYDLIHIPFFDLFTRSLPLKASKPLVVTVHDLIPIIYPTHYPARVKRDCFTQDLSVLSSYFPFDEGARILLKNCLPNEIVTKVCARKN
jgi:hypothetical protein